MKEPNSNEKELPDAAVVSKIYMVRGQKVMLDRDLAQLYGVKSIRLREQVRRNIRRFPSNFMFQLDVNEAEGLVSQNAIPSRRHLGGALPYVFTEHGVLQLANVLRSERATLMSIRIIEVFVRLRELTISRKDILQKLQKVEEGLSRHDLEIKKIFDYLKKLLSPEYQPMRRIGFRQAGEK